MILVFLLILSATLAYAEPPPREHGIAEYIFNIHINQDGSAYIEERITNRFTGQFNGVFLDVSTRGFGRLENFYVLEYLPQTGEYIYFDQVRRASTGDDGVFTTSSEEGARSFTVFSPSQDEYRTFVFRYTLTRAATRYTDAGQFYRNLIGRNWEVPIEAYQVNITFENATRGNPEIAVSISGDSIWTFTSASSDISFESNGNILNPGQTLGVNTIFPREWIPNARTINRSVDDSPFPWGRVILISIGAIILLTVAVIAKKAWPHKVDFDESYYDKLPSDHGPAVMAYLWRERQIKIKDVLATLLDMARNGHLTIKNDHHNSYSFVVNSSTKHPIRPHEEFLIIWLFEGLGTGTELTINDIEQAGKAKETALIFHENFTRWVEIVTTEAESHDYYESYWRRTPHGELEYKKWRAFKRYLKNLTNIAQSGMVAHSFWESFLPYALSLGSAKKLMKKLPNIPKPGGMDGFESTSLLWFAVISPQLLSACTDTFSTTFAHAYGYTSAQEDSGGSGVSFSSGGGGSSGGAF